MGTDVAEGVELLPSPHSIKVHRQMCTELIKLVDIILKIFPQIEKARPRCSSGLEALCLLIKGIEKAKSLLQHCSESSKLYLAVTGDAILARCKKSINLLKQGLCMIQNDVPVMLAVQISQIIVDLSDATFSLDPSDVEAGKALKSLLQQNASERDSTEDFFLENMRCAALRLDITSQRSIIIEKRSIRKLLDKLGDSETKKQILFFYFNLLSKYGKSIVRQQTENACVQPEDSSQLISSYHNMETRSEYVSDEAQLDIMKRPIPPEEYKCSISSRLMYDPVMIASGQTFERMWIQKWFDEGHNICPKTRVKLQHLSLTPNSAMKGLISKWCEAHDITLLDPYLQSAHIKSFETSSTSIASLSSSLNDLNLPVDFSSISLGSLDFSHNSDSSDVKMTFGRNYMSIKMGEDSCIYKSSAKQNKKYIEFPVELDGLPWESQCKMVEDVKSNLEHDIQDFLVLSESCVEHIIKFLKDALDQHDLKALRTGCLLLLALVRKCRNCASYFKDGAYDLLASLLNSEVIEEVLFILELLSHNRYCRPHIATSSALTSLTKILDTQIREFQEPAIAILHKLSFEDDIQSLLASSNFIPKLVPLFEDIDLARYCIAILKNLCDFEDARVSVAETNGCIASISTLLETGNYEEQESALAILLSLCSQSIQYCQLVLDEGVIPALVSISNKGNDKGKASAMELLRLLRDVEYTDVQECPVSDLGVSEVSSNPSKEKKHGFWGKIFSKSTFKLPKKKK